MSTQSDDADLIGYKRPPRHTRFQAGRSGNPAGRPKGKRSAATLLTHVLNTRITVTENGRRKRISKIEAMMVQLVNKAISGDPRASRLVLQLMQAFGGTQQSAGESEWEARLGTARAELDAFIAGIAERLELESADS
jgi:hypothetical protein